MFNTVQYWSILINHDRPTDGKTMILLHKNGYVWFLHLASPIFESYHSTKDWKRIWQHVNFSEMVQHPNFPQFIVFVGSSSNIVKHIQHLKFQSAKQCRGEILAKTAATVPWVASQEPSGGISLHSWKVFSGWNLLAGFHPYRNPPLKRWKFNCFGHRGIVHIYIYSMVIKQ